MCSCNRLDSNLVIAPICVHAIKLIACEVTKNIVICVNFIGVGGVLAYDIVSYRVMVTTCCVSWKQAYHL